MKFKLLQLFWFLIRQCSHLHRPMAIYVKLCRALVLPYLGRLVYSFCLFARRPGLNLLTFLKIKLLIDQ